MNWKNIKTFLILLFLTINLYLIITTPGAFFDFNSKTEVKEETVNNTVELLSKNYNVKIDKNIIPKKINNLKIIDVTNIIYTDKFSDCKYKFKTDSSGFYSSISTDTYSYNEAIAQSEITQVLTNMGVDEKCYSLSFCKTDEGLVCDINEKIEEFQFFNGKIKAVFNPSEIKLKGQWYILQTDKIKSYDSSIKMSGITNVLIDLASDLSTKSDASNVRITKIKYGYFVSYYNENTVSKSASAIPCYLVETDEISKYYYDAINGKSLKQEE